MLTTPKGTIERGHLYFFYRPRVEVGEVKSIDDISNFHMLLVPRPPEFAVMEDDKKTADKEKKEDPGDKESLKLLRPGADAIPAPALHSAKQHYRLITVGKKRLPDPEALGARGGKSKENFWATVTAVGDDLSALEPGFEAQQYETKTRGVSTEPSRFRIMKQVSRYTTQRRRPHSWPWDLCNRQRRAQRPFSKSYSLWVLYFRSSRAWRRTTRTRHSQSVLVPRTSQESSSTNERAPKHLCERR